VLVLLPEVAGSPGLRLRHRLAPLADGRVAITLATTATSMFGVFLVYTYLSVVFDRATHGSGALVAALIATWGIAATLGSLRAGSLTDRFGNRRVINVALAIAALDFALMPWSAATLAGSLAAIAVWGVCGWSSVVSQQHRLVGIVPGPGAHRARAERLGHLSCGVGLKRGGRAGDPGDRPSRAAAPRRSPDPRLGRAC
jgi:MFS transporter, DHA1 family, inner membrane transport protein